MYSWVLLLYSPRGNVSPDFLSACNWVEMFYFLNLSDNAPTKIHVACTVPYQCVYMGKCCFNSSIEYKHGQIGVV